MKTKKWNHRSFPKSIGLCFVLAITIVSCSPGTAEKSLYILWYKQPAANWNEALPIGNGRIGGMIFGGVSKERIQLNEESLWAGSKINNNNPQALEYLKEIQQLLLEGRNDEAMILADKYLTGTPPRLRSYQPLGDLFLEFGSNTAVADYRRELNLASGISKVTFKLNGIYFQREMFASAPDNVIVVNLNADNRSKINVTIRLTRKKGSVVKAVGDNRLMIAGQIIDEDDPLRGPGGEHMKYAAQVLAIPEGGLIKSDEETLIIQNAHSVTLLITGATDYNFARLDFDRSINPQQICESIINLASQNSYKTLKNKHIAEHRALFDRVQLDLGKSDNSFLPTDQRLNSVKEGTDDPELISLYFQYGRYLLMGSSRQPGLLPANLQGIWNEHMKAPWNSDYHTNINLQMNYWPAMVCNLQETMLPLVNFVDKLRVPGRLTAREMYGARGWTMHHGTDIFGRTAVQDAVRWGMFPMAAAWMTFPVWCYFEYTDDENYLREKAYPIMKDAARFVLDFLIEYKTGHLVTAPSYSPENTFYLPGTKKQMQLTYAPTMDIQIIKELFLNCLRAIEVLNCNAEFKSEIQRALQKLPAIQIGQDGTIQEWIKDYEEVEPGHRHMSHLLGLHPGSQITADTPELLEAARKTIEQRLQHGGGHTGWSRAWIINFYARLHDGENAFQHVKALLQKSTLPNLFDNHPPFQIDGNFGGTAGIAEMLIQSFTSEIHLLPALPSAWPNGSVKGICAHGGFVVDIYWKNHSLSSVKVLSKNGNNCTLRYNDKATTISTKKGTGYQFNNKLEKI